ncbi:MAG: hypothetical protein ABIG63_16490 [Chloroflexota bacterium]
MTPSYAFSKVDKIHADIRKAARGLGYIWVDTFRQGDGVFDAVVLSLAGRWITLEIKSPGGKLTRKEKSFVNKLPSNAPHYIIHNLSEFIEAMKEREE